jgi:hypothetical protein
MPLLIKTFSIIAGAIAVPIFGVAIIAANYSSPFVMHLADVIQGSNTSVVAGTNAPNWSIGTPLAQIPTPSVATTTGTLASSTPFSVAIAAIDPTGTTTLSTAVVQPTDANGLPNEGLQVTWGPVAGAQAYAIFVATGTVTTASGFSEYFYATNTNAYTLSTTTGTLAGSYTKSDTTAFSFKLNPSGPSYINGANGTATTTSPASTTALQINGNFVSTAPATTTQCYSGTAGQIFYNTANSHEWGCNGTAWQKIF